MFIFLAAFLGMSMSSWSATNETCSSIITKVQEKSFADALCLLECYKKAYGEDCLFEAMLVYIADSISEDDLCLLFSEGKGKEYAELFLKVAQKKTKESVSLQAKSELLARMLLTQEPCVSDNFALFAQVARTFQNIPPLDYIALRRAYGNIVSLNCYDCEAYGDMAYSALKAGWIDYASILYCRYLEFCWGSFDHFKNYADVLKYQYNLTRALRINELYGRYVGYDKQYWLKRADILNYVNFSEYAYNIYYFYLNCDPQNFTAWGALSQAAATINHRYEALYALERAECYKPGDYDTYWAEWLTLPPIMSRLSGWSSCYHESTTLQNVTEGGVYYAAYDPNTKYIAGFEAFQTKARKKLITVGGIFRLVGPQNQDTAEVETGWLGIEKLLHPKLLTSVSAGAARQNIAGATNKWSPMYALNLESRQSDQLNLKFASGYNYYQTSPRASAFQIRRWRNELTIDYLPTYDTQLLTILDGRAYSDGNKQFEAFLYSRHNLFYLENWKITCGLMGNWLTTRKDPIHGYYAPYIFQLYAAQAIAEFRVNRHSTIKAYGSAGTQKDNFSTIWGPYVQTTLDCLLEFSLSWRLKLLGDYYYLRQSGGSFNYLKFWGELTYRF